MLREGAVNMKRSFLGNDKPLITVMVQADNPDRIKELMDKSVPDGAEAFGIQFEQMKSEYRTKEVYKTLFSYAKDKPVYVTNYRHTSNEGKSDDVLATELAEIAECGADLCDVIGDCFDRQHDEVARSEKAIQKQTELIDNLHQKGVKVLMSSHIMKFTSAQRVLEIANQHKRVGADISKIVVGAESMEEQIENLRIANLLKKNLGIPFLFLSSGECKILRRIGGELGCCMYLCVYEHDNRSTPEQPLLKNIISIRENMM